MEDPSEEWRIQEYLPPEEESNSILRSIWSNGPRLGKKIAVTGVVISSAPFLLPPLVVLSALGVTFSVPFGLAFASYACTEKLMSHLFSDLRPPPLLEYGTISRDEEEEHRVDREGQNIEMLDYETIPRQDGYDMEAEEEELEEDVKNGVEMQIELVDEGSSEIEEEETMPLDTKGVMGIGKGRKAVTVHVNVANEDDEYERDVGEFMEKEKAIGEILKEIREAEQELSSSEEGRKEMYVDVTTEQNGHETDTEFVEKEEAVGETLKGIREVEEELSSMEEGRREMPADAVVIVAEVGEKDGSYVERAEELAVVLPKGGEEEHGHKQKFGDVDEEELARETTGLIEAIRDEGKDDSGKKVNLQSMQENGGIVGSGELKAPSANQKDDANVGLQKDIGFVERAKEMEKYDKILAEDTNENRKSRDVVVIPKDLKPGGDTSGVVEGTRCDRNLDSMISIEAEAEKTYGGASGGGDIVSCTSEKQMPIAEEKLAIHVNRSNNHISTYMSEEVSSDRKGETLVIPNEVVHEVHQDLPDQGDGRGAPETHSYSLGRMDKEVEAASGDVIHRSLDYFELLIPSGVSVPKPVETISEQETAAGPNEALPDELKIWEEIHAMRMIVGYRATPRSSCIEELKALYVFTGVEPPASVKDSSDVEDINEKLHFLKSVIGVK